ncbi:putative lipoprotein [Sphingobium chlorophenolicum L-1]|uniref:Putative lipoprotein n=1 Tax=Sphingobium chlorophenolicum L-1 TaxID=690566 RepID=F6EYC3_SPHCR|nr:lipoprotein [Sphingobium chlorophenolicum]AEG50076.1 putative lipoprotein [Sphingobium chlorophenolicum L-1]
MNKTIIMAAAFALTGCVSMGTDYDETAVGRLQKGMTKAEVIQLLGQPNQVITASDGGRRLVWVHSTGSMFGANARSVGLPFGPDGKLVSVPAEAVK